MAFSWLNYIFPPVKYDSYTDFSDGAIAYVKANAERIEEYAGILKISPLGVAGAVAREITGADKLYLTPAKGTECCALDHDRIVRRIRRYLF